jgi:hypothetical protein
MFAPGTNGVPNTPAKFAPKADSIADARLIQGNNIGGKEEAMTRKKLSL